MWSAIALHLTSRHPVKEAAATHVLVSVGGVPVKVQLLDGWVIVAVPIGPIGTLSASDALAINGRLRRGALFSAGAELYVRRADPLAEVELEVLDRTIRDLVTESVALIRVMTKGRRARTHLFGIWAD